MIREKREAFASLRVPSRGANVSVVDHVSSIPESAEFNELLLHFSDYPERALMGIAFRATLFSMLRTLRPTWAIEIGTLFAGSSETIASAIAANGEGRFTTIDPFGGHRVPAILAGWPKAFQDVTTFSAINSMQLFMDIESGADRPDFFFIDGNHEYEFALFDLLNAARYLKRGGIIILDNYADVGVRLAADRFEADNPSWTVVTFHGGNVEEHMADLYRVYVAPETIAVGANTRTATYRIHATSIEGLHLKLATPTSGIINYKVYLRSFPHLYYLGQGEAEELSRSGSVAADSLDSDATIVFDSPLISERPRDGFNRTCEIAISFVPGADGRLLHLLDEPQPKMEAPPVSAPPAGADAGAKPPSTRLSRLRRRLRLGRVRSWLRRL